MKSLLITATDTGVGKTVVTAGLLAAARQRGLDAAPMKPTQTGCVYREGRWVAPDLEFCYGMSGYRPEPAELGLACPFPFEPACSPHLAAAMAGRRVSLPSVVYRFRRLCERHPVVFVEGVGGVRVPLNEQDTMLDLMHALGLPVLVVTRCALGTLNHTLLTADALRTAGIPVLGLVAVHTTPGQPGLIEADNLRALPERTGLRLLACVDYEPELAGETPQATTFQRTIAATLNPVLDALDGFIARGNP
jgi:dethiobiotin synthetase